MSAVSILLPFHNAGPALGRAIDSILDQLFVDRMLLLIDNASTDGSRAMAMDLAKIDPSIHVLEEPVIGIAHALRTGLMQAHTPFIARMDADDISHPERLSRQMAFMEAHPEIGVVGTRTSFVSTVPEHRGMRAFVEWQNAILTPHDHYIKRFVDVPLAHPSVLFRRELVERHGTYSTDPLPEDHELWMRWMDAGVRFAKLPEVLLTWNDHPARLSRTHPNYDRSTFFRTKARWMAKWLRRKLDGRPVIIAGTSAACLERAGILEAEGIPFHAFTDVRRRDLPGRLFIDHDELPPPGEAFIISFISQRGTGDRIAAYLGGRGLVEGVDFLLAA